MKNKKLVLIPGPTPVVRSIQDQMGRETVAFGDPAFVADFKWTIDALGALLNCSGQTFVVAGTGTMAMEMAVANVTKKGDSILIVSNGFFGDRFIDLCTRKGLDVDVLAAEWGTAVTPEQVDAALSKKKYAAMTVTHVDTSTGVCAPVAAIGEVMKKHPETIYIVDGVCATGAEPEDVDGMNIDVLFTGSQKAFGVCPGLMMLWASKRAMDRRASLGTIPEFYIDFDKWVPIMQDPSKYFATPAINLVWALQESVRLMQAEGIQVRYARHKKVANAMRKALAEVGLTPLAKEPYRAVTLSCLLYPEGINDMQFRTMLAEEGAQVAGGLAAYAGKMFRLGHMGHVDNTDMVAAVAAIERTLYRQGAIKTMGKAVGVLMQELLAD